MSLCNLSLNLSPQPQPQPQPALCLMQCKDPRRVGESCARCAVRGAGCLPQAEQSFTPCMGLLQTSCCSKHRAAHHGSCTASPLAHTVPQYSKVRCSAQQPAVHLSVGTACRRPCTWMRHTASGPSEPLGGAWLSCPALTRPTCTSSWGPLPSPSAPVAATSQLTSMDLHHMVSFASLSRLLSRHSWARCLLRCCCVSGPTRQLCVLILRSICCREVIDYLRWSSPASLSACSMSVPAVQQVPPMSGLCVQCSCSAASAWPGLDHLSQAVVPLYMESEHTQLLQICAAGGALLHCAFEIPAHELRTLASRLTHGTRMLQQMAPPALLVRVGRSRTAGSEVLSVQVISSVCWQARTAPSRATRCTCSCDATSDSKRQTGTLTRGHCAGDQRAGCAGGLWPPPAGPA